MAQSDERPDPVDVAIGDWIRKQRTLLSMSHQQLGGALQVTFQQVQRYERGVDRVSPLHSAQLCRIFDVAFRDVLDAIYVEPHPDVLSLRLGFRDPQVGFASQYVDETGSSEIQEVIRLFDRIKDQGDRKKVMDFLRTRASPPNQGS